MVRREGKGNPLARGLPTERPFVVAMETGIIGTKQRQVAGQQESKFRHYTTDQGTPEGGPL